MGVPIYDFSGRRVLVTGGGRGLGLRVARAFQHSGAAVVVTGTQSLVAYYDSDLSDFEYEQLDLTDDDSIGEFTARVGRFDVLVSNAAPGMAPDLDPGEREFIAHAARIGLVGPLQLATRLRLGLSRSTARGGGSVIYLPSVKRWFDLTHDTQSAAGELVDTIRRLGTTWARGGVRVNGIVAPAAVPVQRSSVMVAIERNAGPLLTRTDRPDDSIQDDLIAVALFLASSGAAGISGQTLRIGDVD